MIRVNVMDDSFNRAFWRAKSALPVDDLESPRQYGQRWREAYRCRVDPDSSLRPDEYYYIFDQDADYTWFMLQWG
jgi:hypothetical protein